MDIVFIEIPEFIHKVDKLATDEDVARLQADLLDDPYRGDIIKGTGGARKVRMRLGSKGKSGGARVVYYFIDLRGEVWLLDIYAKSEKEELTENEKKNLYRIIKETIQ